MTLTKTAYLVVERDDDTDSTFEISINLQYQSQLEKSYILGPSAVSQYVREFVNETPGTGSFDATRRTGWWVDGGAGNWTPTLNVSTGLEDVQWGDGSGGTGPENVTELDASGEDVTAISRLHVLQYTLAKTKSDSTGSTSLHYGEWTNGDVPHIDPFDPGAFGEPMPVAVRDTDLSAPDPDSGDQVSLEGTIQLAHVALWGSGDAPDWADEAVGAALDAADFIPEQ